MTAPHLSLLVRWFLIASILLLILVVTVDLISYPEVVTTARNQGVVYLVLSVLAVLIYGWFALFRTRARTPAEHIALQQGTLWGLLCGAMWVIELLIANLLSPQLGWLYLVLYYGSTFSGYLLPGLASFFAVWRTRRIVSGLQAGLLCGMFGALAIFLAFLVFSPLLFKVGLHDPQTLHDFQQSGFSEITTYMMSDYLAGMIAHLWIGLITGLFLGMLGGALGKAILQPEKTALEENGLKA